MLPATYPEAQDTVHVWLYEVPSQSDTTELQSGARLRLAFPLYAVWWPLFSSGGGGFSLLGGGGGGSSWGPFCSQQKTNKKQKGVYFIG